MTLKLTTLTVGPWPMNGYVVTCEETNTSAIIDPGAEAEKFLAATQGTRVAKILLTHGHSDHVGALAEVKKATGALVFLHPSEREAFGTNYDISLRGGDTLRVGSCAIRTYFTPGHTPGMISFSIGENRVLVGDTLFVNGPGRTQSARDFATTIHTLKNVVFQWPDETRFYPGHGPSGLIGDERPRFSAYVARGYDSSTHGDVTWE